MTYAHKIPDDYCTIDEAARYAGTSPNCLRIWEARYDWPKPQRLEGSDYRVYSRSILGDLKRIVGMISSGMTIGSLIRDGQPVSPQRRTSQEAELRVLLRAALTELVICSDPYRGFSPSAMASRKAVIDQVRSILTGPE